MSPRDRERLDYELRSLNKAVRSELYFRKQPHSRAEIDSSVGNLAFLYAEINRLRSRLSKARKRARLRIKA